MNIRPLDAADRGYALFAWRESAKKAPGLDRVPWGYYKDTVVRGFEKLLEDPSTVVLGAYEGDKLLGWLAMTPGKRVSALHWVHVKHELDGERIRRRGVMTALLDTAELGARFIYTLRGRRLRRDERIAGATSLDEVLVAALREKGVSATYVSLKEYMR